MSSFGQMGSFKPPASILQMGKGVFQDCGFTDDFDSSKKEDHRSRKSKGKEKDSKRRKNRLDSVERDYLENVAVDEEPVAEMVLSAEDLLKSLDQLNFIPGDSSDDENLEVIEEAQIAVLRASRKNKANLVPVIDCELYQVITFNQLNRDLKLFLKDDDEEIFECGPAPGDVRKFVHLLGNIYRLKSLTIGRADEKRIILQKTEISGLPANPRDLDQIVEKGNKALKWASGESKSGGKKKGKGGCKGAGKAYSSAPSAKPTPGSIVGNGSGPITESNIGNIMLKKMGWEPGTGLGRDSNGITQPIAAVVKAKRQGLV
jgi:hypothetical protein